MFSNNRSIVRLLCFSAVVLGITTGCSKQKGFGPNYDDYSGGTAPVVIQNAVDYRPDPTVTTSLGGDSSIKIVLTLGSGSKHTFKEITKVATSSSYTAIQSSGTTGFYNVPAIPATGTTVTFTTSIKEYRTNNTSTKDADIKINTELTNRFYFRVTLDDGSIVYPTPVRVLMIQ
jgi:hypothetical protein